MHITRVCMRLEQSIFINNRVNKLQLFCSVLFIVFKFYLQQICNIIIIEFDHLHDNVNNGNTQYNIARIVYITKQFTAIIARALVPGMHK